MRFKQFLKENTIPTKEEVIQWLVEVNDAQPWLTDYNVIKFKNGDEIYIDNLNLRPNNKWDGTFPFKFSFIENLAFESDKMKIHDLSKIKNMPTNFGNLHIVGDKFTNADSVLDQTEVEFLHIFGDIKITKWPKVSRRIYISHNDKIKSFCDMSIKCPELHKLQVENCKNLESLTGISPKIIEAVLHLRKITDLHDINKKLKYCEDLTISGPIEKQILGLCFIKGLFHLIGHSDGAGDFERACKIINNEFLNNGKYDAVELVDHFDDIGLGAFGEV